MESVVAKVRKELEVRGEYVAMANISSGWFAVFPDTWHDRIESAQRDGREGPNLVVYRTKSTDPRDHHVVPFSVARDLLIEDALTHSKVNGPKRWNATLKDGKLHVTHRPGKVDVSDYYGARLVVETSYVPNPVAIAQERLINEGPISQVLEGIAREITVIARSRSRKLRESALRRSKGICEACGTDFSLLFDGKGLRALQVHHKEQVALQDVPKLTSSDDLAVVCANCHAFIHSDPASAIPVDLLRQQWATHNEAVPPNPTVNRTRRHTA
jgi:hypothetical protein